MEFFEMLNIPEQAIPVSLLKPAADSGGRTSAYVSLKNVLRAFVVVYADQGNAATIALTPLQASDVSGTGSKVLSQNVPVYTNQDAAAGVSFTRQTDAANFTTSAAVKVKIVVFEIDPARFDLANSFDCFAIQTGASNASNITSAMLYAVPRYAGKDAPTMLTD